MLEKAAIAVIASFGDEVYIGNAEHLSYVCIDGHVDMLGVVRAVLDAVMNSEPAARLRARLAEFDAEVASELANEGERADLWTEIEVNVNDLRAILEGENK